MTVPSEIERHLDGALFGVPRRTLVAVRRPVEEDLPWLVPRVVRAARVEGHSWAQLGRSGRGDRTVATGPWRAGRGEQAVVSRPW